MAPAVALLTRDSLVQRRVVQLAGRLGLEALQLRSAAGEPSSATPAGLLVEL